MSQEQEKETKKVVNLTVPTLLVLAVVASFLLGMTWTKLKSGSTNNQTAKTSETQAGTNQTSPAAQQNPTAIPVKTTLAGFTVLDEEVCSENGKPIVYFFGSKSCPHCTWEHPIFEEVAKKFSNLISLHNNMDKNDVDTEVFQKYSSINQGGIPFVVFGCQYARVGSGEQLGEETEKEALTAFFCKLVNNQPAAVCSTVADRVEQIE